MRAVLLCILFLGVSTALNVNSKNSTGPGEWTKTRCNITTDYVKQDCFKIEHCSNFTISVNNETNYSHVKCEECAVEVPVGDLSNITSCEYSLSIGRVGDCCEYKPRCCVEVYDLCLNSTKCNERCVKTLNSYNCQVTQWDCFNITMTTSLSIGSGLGVIYSPSYVECDADNTDCTDPIVKYPIYYINGKCWYRYNQMDELEYRTSNPCYDEGNSCNKGGLDGVGIYLVVVGGVLSFIACLTLGIYLYKVHTHKKHLESMRYDFNRDLLDDDEVEI